MLPRGGGRANSDGVPADFTVETWDPAAGAYLDTTTGAVRHGQDGGWRRGAGGHVIRAASQRRGSAEPARQCGQMGGRVVKWPPTTRCSGLVAGSSSPCSAMSFSANCSESSWGS